jgi:predicted enzyme related to lactoylglutathione lyase
MTYQQKSYVDHAAIRVKDIKWHIQFFSEVLGMQMRKISGSPENPDQYSTHGGIQLISDPSIQEGQFNRNIDHIGIMVEDLDDAIAEAKKRGIHSAAHAINWLQMPNGLILELIQARPSSAVKELLLIDARKK